MTDLTIPLSKLEIAADRTGHLPASDLSLSAIALVLQTVTEEVIGRDLDGAALNPVSVTIDVTGEVNGEDDLTFAPRIDRRTRTLVFASGLAKQNGRPLLKATMVFRIG